MYVEFSEENMPGIVYKFVRKMRKEYNLLTYIPDAFRERAEELEQAAFKLRHMTPSYNTKIRWGWGDLLLERRIRGSNEPYKTVKMTDLPPWTCRPPPGRGWPCPPPPPPRRQAGRPRRRG